MAENPGFVKQFAGWADAAQNAGNHEFAAKLMRDNQGDKAEIMRRVREAGLPVQDSLTLPMAAFLQDSQAVMSSFSYPLYWGSVIPAELDLRKKTAVGLNGDEMLQFVLAHKDLGRNPTVLLNEYEKNVYGGQIISNEYAVLVEMAAGNQQNFVQGSGHGEVYRALRRVGLDPGFVYSTPSIEHRQILWQVLSYIRNHKYVGERSTDVQFMPGYFEFAVTEAPNRPGYGVTFFDYKTSETFLNYRP